MKQNKVIVVVPTYNNLGSIKKVIEDILAHDYEVIVVDDGSDTSVKDIFTLDEQKEIHFIRHELNQGKGQAIISGTQRAKELGYLYVLSMDGDGQHLASQAQLLINECHQDEIIIGARNFNLKNVPLGSKFGRWFSNIWAKLNTKMMISDSLSGYRIYPVSILDLPIQTKKFDWEMEVLIRHAQEGKNIKEVGIECYYPLAEERVSHFRNFEDTMSIVWVHLQILFHRFVDKIKKLFKIK